MEDNINNIVSDQDNLKLMIEGSETDDFSTLPLRRAGFDDDKEFIKFIKNVERLVRSSTEYRDWTSFVKDVLGYSNCALTEEKTSEITLEVHHYPINLFVVCKGVITDYINKQKNFCTSDITLEVLNLHFENRIGYIPLISSLHEKFHSGFLQLPIHLVHGDWRYILNTYPLEEIEVSIISEFAQTKDTNQKWTVNNYPGVVNG
jgi:hypothetical protein